MEKLFLENTLQLAAGYSLKTIMILRQGSRPKDEKPGEL